MNKIILFPFFLSLLFPQISFVNELEARHGTSENEYDYSEIFFDSRLILQNTDFMIEGLLSIEQSSPPEIGLDEKGLRLSLIHI